MIGLGMLAGIGFTMSIFIALLSFPEAEFQTQAKFSILLASILSGSMGYILLRYFHKKQELTKNQVEI
jgi:NhaA family Na+:H+ antiporter